MEATFVVVGGGIAGVSCAEMLTYLKPNESIILVTESPVVKAVVNLKMITKTISSFDVIEQDLQTVTKNHNMIKVIQDSLIEINSKSHTIFTKENRIIRYKYLCLCTGAKPKIIPQGEHSPYVLGIRDTDSVDTLISKIGQTRRMALIGNGGIATELAHKIQNVEVDWVIKDGHTTATFLDPGSAEFFRSSLNLTPENTQQTFKTHMRYKQDSKFGSGAALGPDWYTNLRISGASTVPKCVKLHSLCEVADIKEIPEANQDYPVVVKLTNSDVIHCDLIVSATGVTARSDIRTDAELSLMADHGVRVNEFMRTSLEDVFAAGDLCSPGWEYAHHWFPMKLWSQARQMGCYAAKCIVAEFDSEQIMQDFCFELFSHSTKLFDYKVVLLGLYNGQKLGTDYECLIRMTPGAEFIKFVMRDNRLQGAILIGNTDLAETCENLILNQLDLSPYGEDILNPDIDIEDYFD